LCGQRPSRPFDTIHFHPVFKCVQSEMRTNMPNNFYYAAYSYLDEWMQKDSRFHQILAFERRAETSATAGAECLVEVAKHYKVIRTLRRTEENFRLEAAYKALHATEPPTESDVVEKVEAFARALGNKYGGIALSASSKILWMRFRSPVIIYDSIVADWLCKNCGYKDDGYPNYHRIWSRKYREYEEEIEDACAELNSVKKFTLAREVSAAQLSEWANSKWFKQRVFDHFILNAAT
jgi:hypothetical protein